MPRAVKKSRPPAVETPLAEQPVSQMEEPTEEVALGPVPDATSQEPDGNDGELNLSSTVGRPMVYDHLEIHEYSVTSKMGPLTVEVMKKKLLKWETESEYQTRMVKEKPSSKPDHHLFGDVFHCLNTAKEKVCCWSNANNRPFDQDWCDDLVHTILSGQWAGPLMLPGETVNGETIRVSRHGRVLSGQHQMTACVLADEWLQSSRAAKDYDPENPTYPAWDGHEHCVIETILITGLSEDERVLQSIDYVKPRSLADMLYTMDLFKRSISDPERESTPKERQELTRMLAVATGTLWDRTNTQGYRTHTEMSEFLKRHKRLLKCVEHLYIENTPFSTDKGGRKISKLRISVGLCSALCYLMGSSGPGTDSDEYRNMVPPAERGTDSQGNKFELDWSMWDHAISFWSRLAKDEAFIPVRVALNSLIESEPSNEGNQGLGGRVDEKLAIIAKAWEVYRDLPPDHDTPFTEDDLGPDGALCLSYTDLDDKGNKMPEGKIALVDDADFLGIDCPVFLNKAGTRTRSEQLRTPLPPAPDTEEIERASVEQRKKRAK